MWIVKGEQAQFQFGYTIQLKQALDDTYNVFYGLSINTGIAYNKKINVKGIYQGKIEDIEIPYSVGLTYMYKKIGLAFDLNESLNTIQTINFLGQTIKQHHRWLNLSFLYSIYERKPKSN